ncbi:MAG: hypothetical protein HY907_16740 [Deltaproteobacteria bacterium]|nr:hypothetical protein [Deltaproteobacteria bacterium]
MGSARYRAASSMGLSLLAVVLVLSAGGVVRAQGIDDTGCRVDADGTLVCVVDVIGQARVMPQVVMNREPLGEDLAELRASFLDEIETSVRDAPF